MTDDHQNNRTPHPIVRGFPVTRVNDLANRERRAKLYYRPLSVMHKWWARRLGSVFRAICLYTLVNDPKAVSLSEQDSKPTLADFGENDASDAHAGNVADMLEAVSLSDPDALWELYPKDVQVSDTSVLDPFMGAGTTLMEAARFGADVTGVDLNPVAWFIAKKALEAHEMDRATLEAAFEQVESTVTEELQSLYKTPCPHDSDHEADVVYGFWVRELDCVSCDHTVSLFKDYRVAKGRYDRSDRDHILCPDCGNLFLTDDYRESAVCSECSHEFVPKDGPVSRGGNYGCSACGLKYPIIDAIAEGQSYDERLYAVEYYCTDCDDAGNARPEYKGYKAASDADQERFDESVARLADAEDLGEYIPSDEIPEGAVTASSSVSGNDVFQHGFDHWEELFNERQRYCLGTLLKAIDDVEDEAAREFLLLAFSDSLMFQSTFCRFNVTGGKVESIFDQNSFAPRGEYVENNVWGTRAGRGTFQNTWEKIRDAVEFAHEPVERYLEDGELRKTDPFDTPVGGDATILQGDMREVDLEGEYDAIITDPPYYDDVVYSEISDFFYVWQRQLLADEYPCFEPKTTPRQESIVPNPAIGKGTDEFEQELGQAFDRMHDVLDEDGILVFTYRHEGPETWGPLLESLCDAGFDVDATYPVSVDVPKLTSSEGPEFTVIVVARSTTGRSPVSWSALRRRLFLRLQEVRDELDDSAVLSQGVTSVIQMGACFREYSTHFGQVHRSGELMSTTDIVAEILDLVSGEVNVDDIYLSLLSMESPSHDDVVRLCRGTNVDLDDLRSREMIKNADEFTVMTWQASARQSYIEARSWEERSDLEILQRLRHLASDENDRRLNDALAEIEVSGDLIDLADRLAEATGDADYRELL